MRLRILEISDAERISGWTEECGLLKIKIKEPCHTHCESFGTVLFIVVGVCLFLCQVGSCGFSRMYCLLRLMFLFLRCFHGFHTLESHLHRFDVAVLVEVHAVDTCHTAVASFLGERAAVIAYVPFCVPKERVCLPPQRPLLLDNKIVRKRK